MHLQEFARYITTEFPPKVYFKDNFHKNLHITEHKAAILLIHFWHKGNDKAFAWGWRVGDKVCILAWLDFLCLIINRGFLNGHWDIASPLGSDHLGQFISNKEIYHIQTKPAYITAVVLWPGLHHSPVISFPLPCRVAAQRTRTEIRVILAIVSPILDKPFLSLRFQGGRAWSSLHVGFWNRGKGALFFYLLQVGDNHWQQKQRGSRGNFASSLSFALSLGNLPLLPAQLGSLPTWLWEKGISKLVV